MKQRLRWIAAASAVVVTLCGCQANPEQNVVISKNDGVLEKKLTISAASEGEVAQIVWYESFLSTDGSIEYTIDLDTDIEYKPLPTLKVVPRFLTGEDVHRAAQALVPGAEFYELPSSSKMIYSKSELLAKVNRWAEYASEETAKTLFDISDQYLVPDMLEYIKEGIVYYTQKAETAPEECPHTLCQWTFQKERIYRDDPMQILGRDPADDLDVIIANALKDGVEYTINASTRNQEDYKLNTIDLQLCDGNNMTNIDLAIYRKMFCRIPVKCNTRKQAHAAMIRAVIRNPQIIVFHGFLDDVSDIDRDALWQAFHTIRPQNSVLVYLSGAPAPGQVQWTQQLRV